MVTGKLHTKNRARIIVYRAIRTSNILSANQISRMTGLDSHVISGALRTLKVDGAVESVDYDSDLGIRYWRSTGCNAPRSWDSPQWDV